MTFGWLSRARSWASRASRSICSYESSASSDVNTLIATWMLSVWCKPLKTFPLPPCPSKPVSKHFPSTIPTRGVRSITAVEFEILNDDEEVLANLTDEPPPLTAIKRDEEPGAAKELIRPDGGAGMAGGAAIAASRATRRAPSMRSEFLRSLAPAE